MRPRTPCLLIVALLLAGCQLINGSLPPPKKGTKTGTFKAGAARNDITPMPGYPMGGFAAGGRISRGVWTRLYARAVCFEDPDGIGLAVVSCDLWSMPAGLADRVSELVATTYGVPQLGRENIVIAATHTHHSPGNYSSSIMYNLFASSEMGFDRRLFNFLAHRIAATVAEAWRGLVPATLIRNETRLGEVARNRSVLPFLANDEAPAVLAMHEGIEVFPTKFPVDDPKAYKAYDPTLTVLRAMPAGGGKPIGVLAFFAIHPTAMGPATEVYSSDLFGVAATTLEREGDAAVVAFVNGAEGDISSNWERQDRPATIRIGEKLTEAVRDRLAAPGDDITGRIQIAFESYRIADVAPPMAGAPMLAGSEGDWTFLRDAGWREGMLEDRPEHKTPRHGDKMNPLGEEWGSRWTRCLFEFGLDTVLDVPESVRLGVYRVGPTVLATLPGEFSTVLGRRIAKAVKASTESEDRVLLVGLANEYVSYFTTHEEHDHQHYEGASMLYGPEAGEGIRDRLAHLGKHLGPPDWDRKSIGYSYRPGPAESFGVEAFDLLEHQHRLRVTFNSLANVLYDEDLEIPVPNHPYFIWIDDNPEWPCDPRDPAVVSPAVAIHIKVGDDWRPLLNGGVPEDDGGPNFVTTSVVSLQGKTRWVTIWMVPDWVRPTWTLRFHVESNGGTFKSRRFTLEQSEKDWGYVGITRRPSPVD